MVRHQAGQITAMAGQLSELMETNETLAGKLARLEHLLSRNSGNSSSPPSRDDDPGKPAPPEKNTRDEGGPKRSRGKQPGAPGSHLPWTEHPDDRRDRFPQGRCECGADLGGARDLGIVDRYQQHEIPQVAVKVTQYDQHQVECGCGKLHTAQRPDGARCGPFGIRPQSGRVRGVPDGGARHPRAPCRRAAGVTDRDRPLGRVRPRHEIGRAHV